MKLFARLLSNLASSIEGAASYFATDDLDALGAQLECQDEERELARRQLLLERARIEWDSGSRSHVSWVREGALCEVWLP